MSDTIQFKSGVLSQKHDNRDYKILLNSAILPQKFSLSKLFGVYNQYDIGSCGANAFCTMLSMLNISANKEVRQNFSRLFQYYMTRATMGVEYIEQDSGVTIRDLFKACNRYGTCFESEMPYVTEKFTIAPNASQLNAAAGNRILEYAAVQKNVNDIKSLLYQKKAIVFGMLVTNKFLEQKTAKFDAPKSEDGSIGGHAMLLIGFDNNFLNSDGSTGAFEVRNSWGRKWGEKGNFMLPYNCLPNIFDLWVATKCM